MRVIFLGSAYFGYVYTYAFNPSALSDHEYAVAEPERQAPMGDEATRPAPKPGVSLRAHLAAWLGRRRKETPC